MIAKYLNYLWMHRGQFIRYFGVGFSGTILDIFSLWVLKEFFGLIPVVAVIFNQILVLLYVFLLNKKLSFKARGQTHEQIVKFLILAGANYIFAICWMWVFNHWLEFNYLLVRLVNIALSIAWNFFLYKEWVYKVASNKLKVESL